MVEVKKVCISCSKRISNEKGSAQFPCPKCGKYMIIRCTHCREIATKYTCPECGFEGPN